MRWVYDNEYSQALALRDSEVKELADIIMQAKLIEKWQKRYEKYKGLHECGDFTDSDIDKMIEAESKIEFLMTFIKM
jgi:hypothetical protein